MRASDYPAGRLCAALLLVATCIVLLGRCDMHLCARADGSSVARIQRLELVDSEGNVRGQLDGDPPENALTLYDSARASGVGVQGGDLLIGAKDGEVVMRVFNCSNGEVWMRFARRTANPRIDAGTGPQGEPGITVYSEGGERTRLPK